MKNKWIKFLLKSTIAVALVALAQELISAFVSRPAVGFYLAAIGLLWVAYFAWQAYLTPEEDSAQKFSAEKFPEDNLAAEKKEDTPDLNETLEALGKRWEASLNALGQNIGASLDKLQGAQDQKNLSIQEALKNIEEKVSSWGETLRVQAEKSGTLLENQLVTSSESLKQVAENVERQSGRALTESGEILKGYITEMQQEFKSSAGDLRQQFLETADGLQQKFAESARSLWEGASEESLKKSDSLEQWMRDRVSQMEEATQKLAAMTDGLSSVNRALADGTENAEVNQVEFRASVDSLNKAMGDLLAKLDARSGSHGEEENFVQRLNETLEAFHEKATEILIENAEKTRDILAEALSSVHHKDEVVS